ncbi:MAG: MotA/TolQ/ExbB proton channel family protein [Planctomycetaceae bacterium]
MTVRFAVTGAHRATSRRQRRLGVAIAALMLGALTVSTAQAVSADEGGKTVEATSTATGPFGLPDSPSQNGAIIWSFVGVFLIASIIAVWFAIERLVVLRRGRVIPRPFVERILEHIEQGRMDKAEAMQICRENGSPLAHIFSHGVRKWGKPSVEVEQAIIDGGERQVSQLRKHLRVLNGVATVTPLVGLLGTVIGMIQSFTAIQETANSAGGDEKLHLAVGIATALLTTAAGLAIAIPSLIMYMFLAGRVDALVMDMDELGQELVHLISAEALAEAAAAPRPKTPPPKPKSAGKPSAKSA